MVAPGWGGGGRGLPGGDVRNLLGWENVPCLHGKWVTRACASASSQRWCTHRVYDAFQSSVTPQCQVGEGGPVCPEDPESFSSPSRLGRLRPHTQPPKQHPPSTRGHGTPGLLVAWYPNQGEDGEGGGNQRGLSHLHLLALLLKSLRSWEGKWLAGPWVEDEISQMARRRGEEPGEGAASSRAPEAGEHLPPCPSPQPAALQVKWVGTKALEPRDSQPHVCLRH